MHSATVAALLASPRYVVVQIQPIPMDFVLSVHLKTHVGDARVAGIVWSARHSAE